MVEQEQKVRQFLKERFGGYDDALESTAPLDGIVDSLGLFDLVEFVESEFAITIPNEVFSPQRFSSIGKILELVEEFQAN